MRRYYIMWYYIPLTSSEAWRQKCVCTGVCVFRCVYVCVCVHACVRVCVCVCVRETKDSEGCVHTLVSVCVTVSAG